MKHSTLKYETDELKQLAEAVGLAKKSSAGSSVSLIENYEKWITAKVKRKIVADLYGQVFKIHTAYTGIFTSLSLKVNDVFLDYQQRNSKVDMEIIGLIGIGDIILISNIVYTETVKSKDKSRKTDYTIIRINKIRRVQDLYSSIPQKKAEDNSNGFI